MDEIGKQKLALYSWCVARPPHRLNGAHFLFYPQMKISYKTIPALEYLKNGKLGKVGLTNDGVLARLQNPEMFFTLSDAFKKYCPILKDKVYHVSQPFYDAAEKAYNKLSSLYLDMMKSDEHDFNVSGVFILREFVIYFVNMFESNSETFQCFYMVTTKDGTLLEFYVLDNNLKNGVIGWSSEVISAGECLNNDKLRIYLQTRIVNLASIHMFIKYAEVETKVVLGKSKRRFGDPYRNDTDFPITHLDSKWFTNIVRSEGFSVRGHFRLQPKKVNGEWTKELIWIADFEKHGYTSKARVLSVE